VKIVIAHNAYQQPGGEDTVVSAEKALLLGVGNEVNEYLRHNNEIKSGDTCSDISLGVRTVWSSGSRNKLYRLLKRCKRDIVHFHNTFPLISPAAYYACRDLADCAGKNGNGAKSLVKRTLRTGLPNSIYSRLLTTHAAFLCRTSDGR
jgi:hypothetical protein